MLTSDIITKILNCKAQIGDMRKQRLFTLATILVLTIRCC